MNLALWDWLRDPRVGRIALFGLAAIAVIGAAAGGGWAWYRMAETRNRQAFADASTVALRAQEPNATVEDRERAIRGLEGFLSEHASSSLVPQAAYRLGNLRYEAGQYPAARGSFEVALAKGARGALRNLSALGVAYTWEAQREYARAEAAYEATIRAVSPKDFIYEELLLDLARVQRLSGNPKAAFETYRRILKDVPDSRRADEIRSHLAELESPPAR